MKPHPCVNCAEGSVRRVARSGRVERYLAVRNLPVPAELELPECDVCGEVFLDEKDEAALTQALEKTYRKLAGAKAQNALARLKESGIRERRIESLLDLSPNYLSRIRSGKETSGGLATLLLLFAEHPALIDEAETLWQVEEAGTRQAPLPTESAG